MFRGAWALAFAAGAINVTGLLAIGHQPVSHLTGTTSLLARALAAGDAAALLREAAPLLAFVAGAVAGGLVIRDSALRLRHRYGLALATASTLLLLSIPGMRAGLTTGYALAAAACGLQNALASTYSGAVVRTTHVSGMFTDLGIALGHALRGLPVDRLRLRLCATVIGGFLAGGVAGALAFQRWGADALAMPAAVLLAAAIANSIHERRRQAQARRASA